MPSTVNGIGTWYYGKNNLVTRNDRCEFCGSYEQLKSFDTTLYFVVLFIPLIPLGRKRILDQCPRCKRHRAAKLGQWEKQKGDAILKATEAWQQDRANSKKAIEALGTTIGFHDAESFRQLATPVSAAFPRDADVQIFLGDAYEHFGDAATADGCYRAALTNRPDEASKEALAKFHLRQTRPADAEPLLAHILANKIRPRAPLMLALAEGYQAVGDHESAWRVVDDVGTTFPDLLSEPHYEKIRRSISRHRGTNKVVKSSDRDRRGGAQSTPWLVRHLGLAIVGGVLLIAAIWYLGLAWSLGNHTVSLVNGTGAAYTVDINGRQVSVPAMGHASTDFREGTLKISVPGDLQIPPATVEMHTDFWHRPWNRRVMVINPDRMAVVFRDQTEYAANPSSAAGESELPSQFYLGETFYDLEKADYVFQPFPNSVPLPDADKTVTKTRIDMVSDEDEFFGVLAEKFTPARQLEFLRQHQNDHPARVQLHRRYQTIIQKDQPDYDLAGEYRALLAKHPDDADFMYLLARILDDRDEAVALFQKSADAPKPCPYAAYALGHDALSDGRFDEALTRARQATKIQPNNSTFLTTELETLEALGRYDEALKRIAEAQQQSEGSGAVTQEIRLLGSKPDLKAAQARIDAFLKTLSSQSGSSAPIVQRLKVLLESSMYYAAGDMEAWHRTIQARTSEDAAFAVAVTDGKLDAAQAALTKIPSPPVAGDYFLMYILARRAGRNDVADAMWTKGVEGLKEGGRPNRKLAAALSGAQPPPDAVLRSWATETSERSIVLTAMGLRYPDKKSIYFAAAKKLNFAKRFPQRVIEQVVTAP